jgi:hypothetical protein
MKRRHAYEPIPTSTDVTRREFVKIGTAAAIAGGIVLGVPGVPDAQQLPIPAPPETNVGDFMKVPKGTHALPGPFPGKVVEVKDTRSFVDERFDAKVIDEMFERGIRTLTGKDMKQSFALFFEPGDVVGIKVNPVGPPLINTRPELAGAMIKWLADNKVPRSNIVIWDGCDSGARRLRCPQGQRDTRPDAEGAPYGQPSPAPVPARHVLCHRQ